MEKDIEFRSIMVFEDVEMVNNDGVPKIMLTQPVLNFSVPFLPTQLSFTVVAAAANYKVNQSYHLEIVIYNLTQNEKVIIIPWDIFEEDEDNDKKLGGFFIANLQNIIIPNKGPYEVGLYHNDELLGTTIFDVSL